jgi:uncharacterized membrane protein
MSELVLAAYPSEDTADDVLGVLRARHAELPGQIDSSATVRVAADGAYTVTLTDRQDSGDAFWGVFWEALFGLVFLVPVAGTAYGSNLGGLFGAIDRAGLDAEFRGQVRRALRSRTSGLAVIATGWNPEPVLREFFARPSVVITSSLELAPGSELMHELGGARHSPDRGDVRYELSD